MMCIFNTKINTNCIHGEVSIDEIVDKHFFGTKYEKNWLADLKPSTSIYRNKPVANTPRVHKAHHAVLKQAPCDWSI